jgi:hypothetical protein
MHDWQPSSPLSIEHAKDYSSVAYWYQTDSTPPRGASAGRAAPPALVTGTRPVGEVTCNFNAKG